MAKAKEKEKRKPDKDNIESKYNKEYLYYNNLISRLWVCHRYR